MKYKVGDIVSIKDGPATWGWSGKRVRIIRINTRGFSNLFPYTVAREGDSIQGLVSEDEIIGLIEAPKQLNIYLIQNTKDKELWWEWGQGWGNISSATVYSVQDAPLILLPIEGKWVLFTEERS